MKKVLLAFFASATIFAVQAQTQLPNNGFEQGTGTTAAGWTTIAGKVQRLSSVTFNLQGGGTDTRRAPQGEFFMELRPDTFRTDNGQLAATPGIIAMRIPYVEKPAYLSFETMYLPNIAADQLAVRLIFTKGSDTITRYTVTGQAATQYYPWVRLSAPITYSGTQDPDSLTVLIFSNSPSAQQIGINSRLYVDHFRFHSGNPLGVELKEQSILASEVKLFPNPMNQFANIEYTISERENVTLTVTDITGRQVATLVNERVAAGTHQVRFDRNGLKAGVYIYRIQAGNKSQTGKIIIAD
mgnify:CR=1 FL=1